MSRQRINRFLQLALFAVVAIVVVNFTTITAFASGSGTEQDPYTELQEVIDNYYLTLRTGMVNRSDTFAPVYYAYNGTSEEDTNYDAIEDAVIELYDKALEHTGDWDEGDYIRLNLDHIYAYDIESPASIYGGIYHWKHKITFNPTYLSTASNETDVDTALTTAITSLNLDSMSSEFDKAKAIHDYVCGHVTYDTTLNKHSTYNAVVDRTSVCQGYSSMLYNMMLRAGIDCRVITGTANNGYGAGAHAWNIVKIDGNWYCVDATWDDPVNVETIDDKYFLISDARIESDDYGTHSRGNGIKDNKKVAIDYRHGSDFDKAYPVSLLDYGAMQGCETVINDSIVMYLVLDLPASLVADENAKISVKFPNDGDQYGTFSYEMKLSDGTQGTEGYKYPCTVPSPRMTDMIQVQVVSGDKKSEVYELSFKQYAMALIGGILTEQTRIDYVKALLNLGAYAQLYFGYQTDKLANEGVTDNVKSLIITDAMAEMAGRKRPFVRPTANEGVSYVGSSLVLNSTITIRHYYKVDNPSDLSKLTFKVSGISENVSGKLKSGTNDTVYVESKPYTAREFDTQACNVTVYKDGTEVMKFTAPSAANPGYNVFNYTYNYFEGIKDGNLQDDTPMANLAKAFYLYSKAAVQVFIH